MLALRSRLLTFFCWLTPHAAPWMLNVPMAHVELAASGPHAVVAQPGGLWGRAACTKCRGMNPLLGARAPACAPTSTSTTTTRC